MSKMQNEDPLSPGKTVGKFSEDQKEKVMREKEKKGKASVSPKEKNWGGHFKEIENVRNQLSQMDTQIQRLQGTINQLYNEYLEKSKQIDQLVANNYMAPKMYFPPFNTLFSELQVDFIRGQCLFPSPFFDQPGLPNFDSDLFLGAG